MLLQQRTLNRRALTALRGRGAVPTTWSDLDDLERVGDDWVAALRAERRRLARRSDPITRARDLTDRVVRTSTVEFLDRPDVAATRKLDIVRSLHAFNRVVGAYHQFFRVLRPWLARASEARGGPARVLEIASGAGGFALSLGDLARRRGLDVEVTGSDIVDEYVTAGNALARQRRSAVRFQSIDAFSLDRLERGAFNVIFIAQSVHHFTPGQLARMIGGAAQVATTAFVAIDGHRGLTLLTAGPALTSLWRKRDFLHDAVLSVRKFYAAPELGLLAELAAPGASIDVRWTPPAYTTLSVDLRSLGARS